MKIGKYTLSVLEFSGENPPKSEIWINKEDGEGGSFNIDKLEAAIDEFYEENF